MINGMESNLENKKDKKADRIIYIGILLLSAVFYLIWYGVDGIVLTEDAPSYITMHSDREPGYCTFLAVLRLLFGAELSLHAAVILQCIIAAMAACAVTLGLRKRFVLNWFETSAILLMQYGITFLNRFVAQRRYSYYNSIETEGLSYSIWIFFFMSILGVLYDKNKKSIIMSLVWSVILISIRKQMLMTLVILFFCLIYTGWKDKYWKKAVAQAFVLVLIGFTASKLVDCCYNLAVRGEFTAHSGDSSFILGTEVYLADESMADDIKSDERRELFMEIIRRADEREYNIAYAQKGWRNIEDHYSLSYDRIKFDVIMAVIREYQEERGVPADMMAAGYEEIAGAMMKELLLPCMSNLIKLFVCNVMHGLVTTVLKNHPLLNPVAFLIYCVYFLLLIYLARQHTVENPPHMACATCLPFAAFVLIAVLVNVGLTSATIYPQMRYMLYNTALFYQAGFLMSVEAAGIKNRR